MFSCHRAGVYRNKTGKLMKKPVIICVDDEQMILNSLNVQLERKFSDSFEYEFAESAEEAIDVLEELTKDGYAVVMIISDQIMPGMMGDDFLIHTHQRYPNIIKIMLTGQAGLESAVNAINNANLFSYLTKPWDENDLLLCVNKGLEQFYLVENLRQRNIELEQMNQQLIAEQQAKELALRAKVEADMASRSKSAFLANMSHEIRTPLNSIIGFSELLQEQASEDGMTDYLPDLDKIQISGRHLLQLINNVLDLAKIEAGRVELVNQAASIKAIMQSLETMVIPLMAIKSNHFSCKYAENIGIIVCDELRLKQVLINFLSNAAKFCEHGEVVLTAALFLDDGIESVKFQVSDTGIGMTMEQQQLLFQEFAQATSTTAHKFGGTGLGLFLCKKICLLMGGDIQVDSMPGKGCVFTIVIPLQPGNNEIKEDRV